MSFVGDADIYDLQTMPYDNTVGLSWKCYSEDAPVTVYAAAANKFKEGGEDEWDQTGDAAGRDEKLYGRPASFAGIEVL